MKLKALKISIFSLICLACLTTLFVNLNNDIKTYENERNGNIQDVYTVKEYDGKVAVFKNNDTTPSTVYESYISLLPEQDREKLKSGISVNNKDDLQKIIEDYTS